MCASSSREKGSIGEDIARKYLRHEGYAILDANFKIRMGEIDIIAKEDETIIFVEVKSATRNTFGNPIDWIPVWKQQRIIRASMAYLQRKRMMEVPIRYDVITVDQNKKVFHVRDAFRSPGPFTV